MTARPRYIVDTQHKVMASTAGLVLLDLEQARLFLQVFDTAHIGPVEAWAAWLQPGGVAGYEAGRSALLAAIKRLERAL
jgi:hypothetical protein